MADMAKEANTNIKEKTKTSREQPVRANAAAGNNNISSSNNDRDLVQRLHGIISRVGCLSIHVGNTIWQFSKCLFERLFMIITTFYTSITTVQPDTFSIRFNNLYGVGSSPNFYNGTLQEAIAEATRRRCLLAVYIHCEVSQLADDFARNVLKSNDILSLLNSDKFLVWGACESSSHVVRLFDPRIYPHLAVVLPNRIEERIGIVEGQSTINDTLSVLVGCIHTLEDMQLNENSLLNRNITDRQIREQQDREYQESLQRDALREQELKEKDEMQRKLQEDSDAEALQASRRVAQMRSHRRRLAEEITQSESSASSEPLPSPSPLPGQSRFTKICVRLPTGERLQKSFAYNESLDSVYRWVEACEYLYPDKLSEGRVPPLFKLSKPLSSASETYDRSSTLESLNFIPNVLLLVVNIDDE